MEEHRGAPAQPQHEHDDSEYSSRPYIAEYQNRSVAKSANCRKYGCEQNQWVKNLFHIKILLKFEGTKMQEVFLIKNPKKGVFKKKICP